MSVARRHHNLADFIEWINAWCAGHDRSDGVPMVNDAGWVVTTRQFRRTIAWFIARRPGGSIAGAIAFRHLSVQMFEGYAGTSESGFRAEVESEQVLTRGEHLMAMIDQHEHTPLVGPAAEEANRRLGEFAEAAGFAGTVVTDPHRLRRLLAQADPAIYPGTFATCVFDPAKALCIQTSDSNPTHQPELTDCRPLECANVALAPENLTALRAEIHRIQHELSTRPGLPPLLRHRLSSRRDDIARFLDRNTQRTTCPQEPTCPPSTTAA